MILRPYQADQLAALRESLSRNRAVCAQLATGGGKTPIFGQITQLSASKGNRVWVVAPRNQLLYQASNTLRKYGVPHGKIDATHQESRAFQVHVVSKDTLTRRLDKIKNWPDLLILDESHLNFDFQLKLAAHLPATTKIIGFTATPESLGGTDYTQLYGDLIEGPSIQWLIESGFLAIPRYFAPILKGLSDLKANKAGEFDQDSISELLAERKIYGQAVNHYKAKADGKPALAFCRSVADAEKTAAEFSDRGYTFENIDGKMSAGKQKVLFDALRQGKIQGLTTCELAIYGLDIPQIECLIMLRPTMSLSYFLQMLGRGLRPCDETGKTSCVILDHVNNILIHGDPFGPREWNFNGARKRKKLAAIDEESGKQCGKCFAWIFNGTVCPECGTIKTPREQKEIEVDESVELKEIEPIKLNSRPPEERREYVDKINGLIESDRTDPSELARIVSEMLLIASELKNQPMWVYWRLSEEKLAVQVDVLHEIAKQKGYKGGWVRFKIEEIKKRL